MNRREFLKTGATFAGSALFMGLGASNLFGAAQTGRMDKPVETITLNNGVQMPILGFGTLELRDELGRRSVAEAIAQAGYTTKGVDSTASAEAALDGAKDLARSAGAVVSISGKTDYITDGKEVEEIIHGHPLMGKVTGTGCTATALIAAFAGVNNQPFAAATEAMIVMGMAGEMAGERSDAPGTFYARFIDALYQIDEEQIKKRWKNGSR